MSDRAPCVKCGRILHTGEGRVLVSFTATELFEMATEVVDPKVRARIICALSLIDQDLADAAEGLDGRE